MIYALPAGSRIPYVYIIAWIWGYVKFWDTKRSGVVDWIFLFLEIWKNHFMEICFQGAVLGFGEIAQLPEPTPGLLLYKLYKVVNLAINVKYLTLFVVDFYI